VFILKPGQFVHINKGRLHAFRKLSPTLLPEHDCHAKLREKVLSQFSEKQLSDLSICISIAWDWTFRGITAEAIHDELFSMFECAALNQKNSARSLAIPETSLLHTAKVLLSRLKPPVRPIGDDALIRFASLNTPLHSSTFPEQEAFTILKGILPLLSTVVILHKTSVDKAKKEGDTRHPKLSVANTGMTSFAKFAFMSFLIYTFTATAAKKILWKISIFVPGTDKVKTVRLSSDFL
jgi:hypothetical protein